LEGEERVGRERPSRRPSDGGTGRRRSASFFLWKSAPSVSVVGLESVSSVRGFDRIDYLTLKYGGKKEKKGARLGVDEGLDPLSFVRAAFGYYLLKE
jgi:hypothetical protein